MHDLTDLHSHVMGQNFRNLNPPSIPPLLHFLTALRSAVDKRESNMSADASASNTKPELSQEEKRRSKEEKRLRKEKKRQTREEGASSTSTSTTAASNVATKDEKERKRKRDASGDAYRSVNGDAKRGSRLANDSNGIDEVERKKVKKAKLEGTSHGGTGKVEPSPSIEPAKVLSKKKKKKLAKALTSTSTTLPTPTPASTSTPATTSQVFTPTHQTYLTTHAITLTPSIFPPHLSISSLPVHSEILSFLSQFTEPTPIQACSWPPLLAGRDVVGIAETGSGKTLAFGVPGLDRLAPGKKVNGNIADSEGNGKGKGKGTGRISMLVLAPTRELAQQSHETLAALGKGLTVGGVCLFGGVGKDEQLGGLRRKEVKVIVGTPGRTLDLADSGDLDLSKWVNLFRQFSR